MQGHFHKFLLVFLHKLLFVKVFMIDNAIIQFAGIRMHFIQSELKSNLGLSFTKHVSQMPMENQIFANI